MFRKPKSKVGRSTTRLLKALKDRQSARDQGIYPSRDTVYVADAFMPENGANSTIKSDDCARGYGGLDMAPGPYMEEPDEFLEFVDKIKEIANG